MKATLLNVDAGKSIVKCSEENLEFLRLFVFEDLAALARHRSFTHHGALCPIIIQFILRLKKTNKL